jgi:peptide subunit release factor 1 (eRF1)
VAVSEHLLKVLLSELTTVRVRCLNDRCGATVEVALANLDRAFRHYACPACQKEFGPAQRSQPGPEPNRLRELQAAVEELARDAGRQGFEVEFVLPAKE